MNSGGWADFTLAAMVFAGSYFRPARGGLRKGLIGRPGRRSCFVGYGLVALLTLGLSPRRPADPRQMFWFDLAQRL